MPPPACIPNRDQWHDDGSEIACCPWLCWWLHSISLASGHGALSSSTLLCSPFPAFLYPASSSSLLSLFFSPTLLPPPSLPPSLCHVRLVFLGSWFRQGQRTSMHSQMDRLLRFAPSKAAVIIANSPSLHPPTSRHIRRLYFVLTMGM